MKVYPAILTDSFRELQDQLTIVQEQSELDVVHIDVIDGFFADNLTVTPLDLNEVSLGDLQVDLHLMVNEPLDFVYEAVAGIDHSSVRSIISQVEQMSWQSEYISEVKKHGWRVGLALNLFTPVEAIDDESWDHIDIVQLMAIEAGGQGRSFNSQVLEVLQEVKQRRSQVDRSIEIIIDGGIKIETIPSLATAGADGIAVGSEIWRSADPSRELQELLSAVERL